MGFKKQFHVRRPRSESWPVPSGALASAAWHENVHEPARIRMPLQSGLHGLNSWPCHRPRSRGPHGRRKWKKEDWSPAWSVVPATSPRRDAIILCHAGCCPLYRWPSRYERTGTSLSCPGPRTPRIAVPCQYAIRARTQRIHMAPAGRPAVSSSQAHACRCQPAGRLSLVGLGCMQDGPWISTRERRFGARDVNKARRPRSLALYYSPFPFVLIFLRLVETYSARVLCRKTKKKGCRSITGAHEQEERGVRPAETSTAPLR
jgi:hypothetical protein